jgi:nucleoside-diphosphate-sugar epimerase
VWLGAHALRAALVRDPAAAAFGESVELAVGDFEDASSLARAMDGASRVLLSSADGPRKAEHEAAVIDAAAEAGVGRYFYSSSVCVYRDMAVGEPELGEREAYPAQPDNEYGWEKLYSERVVAAYGQRYGIATRVARFQNTYGPEGTWRGGREKAPAAICRKVAEVDDGGEVEVWGDGSAVRSYTYVDDLLDGIRLLMASDHAEPVNIGNPEYVSVNDLVRTVAEVAGKEVLVRHVDGPVGVQSRNFSNGRIYTTGWRPRFSLREGIGATYAWISERVRERSLVAV